jgi:hypothetical protein
MKNYVMGTVVLVCVAAFVIGIFGFMASFMAMFSVVGL